MTDAKIDDCELVSALADGRLCGEQFARAVAFVEQSDDALAAWRAYHFVGDVLRCPDLANGRDDLAFVARFRGQLTLQPESRPPLDSDLESEFPLAGYPPANFESQRPSRQRASANDAIVRWKIFAGAASLAAAAAIGWQLAVGSAGPAQSDVLAAMPAASTRGAVPNADSAVAGSAGPALMLRDARLDELLAAHRQFGGTSALQMPAGFLRNATFENPK